MWGNLSLTEAETAVVEEEEEESPEQRRPSRFYLASRLFSVRPYNRQALINTMRNLWKPAKDLTVDAMDENCLLFIFQGRGDIDRVLEGRLWFFDKHMILLEEVGMSTQVKNLALETTPIWLRLYDLPIAGWRESVVRKLATRVGKVCQISYSEAGEIGGRYRLQVRETAKLLLPVRLFGSC